MSTVVSRLGNRNYQTGDVGAGLRSWYIAPYGLLSCPNQLRCFLVDNRTVAEAYTNGILEQLNAEIGASDYTVKSLVIALEMDHNTFRRYTKGERAMPMVTLWAAINQLGVSQLVFVQRAQERYESSTQD